jgi:hypothetical protein
MTATAIRLIATREIVARWLMWPVALVLALVAIAVPRMVAETDQAVVAHTIWLSAWVVPLGVSVIVGTTLLGGEHGEGRLAFYFARPIEVWQIVAGKLLGGLVLAIGAQAIFVVLIGLAIPGPPRFATITKGEVLVSLAGVPFGLAAGIAARARTRWLALDIAAIVTVIGVSAVAALRPVVGHRGHVGSAIDRALARAEVIAIASLAILLLALVVAGARAVAIGRTDVARSHGVLSRTLWAIVLPACALVAVIANVLDV